VSALWSNWGLATSAGAGSSRWARPLGDAAPPRRSSASTFKKCRRGIRSFGTTERASSRLLSAFAITHSAEQDRAVGDERHRLDPRWTCLDTSPSCLGPAIALAA
jgi:hypothetical protein